MSDGFKDFSPCSSRRDPAKEPLCCCRWRAFTGSKNNCKTKHFCLLLEHSAITEGTKIKNISFHLVKRGTTAVLPLVPESAGCFLSSSHRAGKQQVFVGFGGKVAVVYAETSIMQVCEHVCMHIN